MAILFSLQVDRLGGISDWQIFDGKNDAPCERAVPVYAVFVDKWHFASKLRPLSVPTVQQSTNH